MIITLNQNEFSARQDLVKQMCQPKTSRFWTRPDLCAISAGDTAGDVFGECTSLHVLSVSEDCKILHGSCRLLPTTGPHMMSEVFGACFGPDAMLRTPLIWEVSRFCGSAGGCQETTSGNLQLPAIEILAGICELGMRHGTSHAMAVFPPLLAHVLRRCGLRFSIISRSIRGENRLLAGLWALDRTTLAALRKSGGFRGSVLPAISPRKPAGRTERAA